MQSLAASLPEVELKAFNGHDWQEDEPIEALKSPALHTEHNPWEDSSP
jgi:hypothetical protein